jgi:hypothetical protein
MLVWRRRRNGPWLTVTATKPTTRARIDEKSMLIWDSDDEERQKKIERNKSHVVDYFTGFEQSKKFPVVTERVIKINFKICLSLDNLYETL